MNEKPAWNTTPSSSAKARTASRACRRSVVDMACSSHEIRDVRDADVDGERQRDGRAGADLERR